MMSKAAEILLLAVFLVMSAANVGMASALHAPSVKNCSTQMSRALRMRGWHAYLGPMPSPAPRIPDFTVQYGYIANPEMVSGSLGAMLQGKNPAAGAIP